MTDHVKRACKGEEEEQKRREDRTKACMMSHAEQTTLHDLQVI